jgi:hypothetical protein
MKKKFLSIILSTSLICILTISNLQAQSYEIGSNVINAGLGLGYSINYGFGNSTPVISGSFEHGLIEAGPGTVGIGGIISYQGNRYSYSDGFGTYKRKWSTTFIAVRGTYHPDALVGDNYDVYGALQLGLYNYGYNYSATGIYTAANYNSGLNSGLGLGLVAGGRYYFTDNIGGFAEIGYDISYLKIGLSIKL